MTALQHVVDAVTSPAVVERIGWLLVHSLWQFALVASLAVAIGQFMRRGSAAARYWMLASAMLLMVMAPFATWMVLLYEDGRLAAMDAQTPFASPVLVAESREPSGDVADAILVDEELGGLRHAATDVILPPSEQEAATTIANRSRVTPWWSVVTDVLGSWLYTIVSVWCCGVLLFSIRPVWSWFTVRRLRRIGTSPVSAAVQQALERMCARLQVTRQVAVLTSSLVSAPVVVGCFRSVILLPASFISGVPASQLEAILAHELAHVRRYDYLVNLLQTLVETLFFYHPAVWWLSHRIRVERENCCDDKVVAALGNKVEYGRALLAVEEFRGAVSSPLALSAKGGSLLARVRRLFPDPTHDDQRSSGCLAALALVATGLLVAAVWSSTLADADDEASVDEIVAAELPGGIRVELHGVMDTAPDSRTCWRADGSPLQRPEDWPPLFAARGQNPTHGFVFRVAGLPRSQTIAWRFPGQWFGPNEIDSAKLICASTRYSDGPTADLKIGIPTADWGPWQRVEKDGTITKPVEVTEPFRDVYKTVKPHVEPGGTGTLRTGLELEGIQGIDDRVAYEAVAVDKNGTRHERRGVGVSKRGTIPYFSQDIGEIDHFEYRMRPYQHWVTFENVSLQAGRKTGVKVKVEKARQADDTIEITGLVTNAQGEPVANSMVLFPFGYDPGTAKPRSVRSDTDQAGRFRLVISRSGLPPELKLGVLNTVWAWADGYAIGVASAPHLLASVQGETAPEVKPITIRLPQPVKSSFRATTETGKPLVGATVVPRSVRVPNGSDPIEGYFGLYVPLPDELVEVAERVTDADGRVSIDVVPRSQFDELEVISRSHGTQSVRLPHGANEAALPMRAVGGLRGRFVGGPAELMRGVSAFLSTSAGETEGTAHVVTDENGSFHVPAIADGGLRIRTSLDPKQPWKLVNTGRFTIAAGIENELTLTMEKAVPVTGRLVVRGGTEPVDAATVSIQSGNFTNRDSDVTDELGEFKTFVAPGQDVVIQVIALTGHPELTYPQQTQTRVTIPRGVDSFRIPDIEIPRAKTWNGRLIDQSGRPVAGKYVQAFNGTTSLDHPAPINAEGYFALHLRDDQIPDRWSALIQWRNSGSGDDESLPTEIVTQTPLVLRVHLPADQK